ncbi:mRNA splicing protein [Dimargaris verticillata]|uniref:Pre-mRNA-processing protein 45 n=1 Tax=Dimargaris verticillata TaxID=2761393 RepID=A0A9W8B508_9FUNG|nr:mRNA splicing protein [Dimargaris verticillata]
MKFKPTPLLPMAICIVTTFGDSKCVLPKPKNVPVKEHSSRTESVPSTLTALSVTKPNGPPPYGRRKGWVPHTAEDFGDGGAFPEVHVTQYPIGLGRKGKAVATRSTTTGAPLSLQVNAQGEVQYDAIARQGHAASQLVQTQFKDLVPLRDQANFQSLDTDSLLERPDSQTVRETAERTRAALEKVTQSRIAAAQPKAVTNATNKDPQYIRYTPNQQGGTYNSGSQQRIVRMVEMPVDPFEPQRFKHKKIPKGPPSPPAPIMHSPPRKPTAEEQEEWFVPPSISNWKNAKGFTIPLDKRLAADGRGLQEVQINDNFAKFADALNAADRHAREGVRQRALQQQRLAQKKKDERDQHLRTLAQQAREARAGLVAATEGDDAVLNGRSARSEDGDTGEDEAYRKREEMRQERQREREREARLSHLSTSQRAKAMARSENRDISEKVALGLAKPTGSKESMFDQRLFNMSEGLSSGFKGDDAYNLYDKPLFGGASGSAGIYRPSRGTDSDAYGGGNAEAITEMLQQDRFEHSSTFQGFKGADANRQSSGPVQFEKSQPTAYTAVKSTSDVFGLDQFMEQAKRLKRSSDAPAKPSGSPSKRPRD